MDAAALPSSQSFRVTIQQSEFPLEITKEEVTRIQGKRINVQIVFIKKLERVFLLPLCGMFVQIYFCIYITLLNQSKRPHTSLHFSPLS